MNKTETSQLLTLAALVDNRAVTPEAVVMWHGLLDDIDYGEAAEALKEYYRTSTKWLMPAHLRDLVEAARVAARKAPGKQLAETRQWLLDHDIDYLLYEAGAPEIVEQVRQLVAGDDTAPKALTHGRT